MALLAEFRPDAGTKIYFQSADGAVADVLPTATAFSHRGVIANMMLFGGSMRRDSEMHAQKSSFWCTMLAEEGAKRAPQSSRSGIG